MFINVFYGDLPIRSSRFNSTIYKIYKKNITEFIVSELSSHGTVEEAVLGGNIMKHHWSLCHLIEGHVIFVEWFCQTEGVAII